MNVLLYIVAILLLLSALYIDVFSFIVNVRKLLNRKYNVSGIPIVALLLYIIAVPLMKTVPFPMAQMMLVLVSFHILTHLAIPLISHVIRKHTRKKYGGG